MRIPRSWVHKSSQTYQRSILLPPHSATHEHARSRGDNTVTIKSPLSRRQSGSPALSGSTFSTYRKESSSPHSPESYQKKTGSETRKSKALLPERSNGGHVQAREAPNLRSHKGDRVGHGHGLTEKRAEGHACTQEHVNYARGGQIFGNGEQNLNEAEKDEPLEADRSLINRRNHATHGPKIDVTVDTKASSFDTNHGLTAKSRIEASLCNRDLLDENVYIKPQNAKQCHGEACSETAREPQGHGSAKEKMAEGDFVKIGVRNDSETQFYDVSTQRSTYFDVATQMSSLDVHRSTVGDPQLQSTTVTAETIDQARNVTDFMDSTTCPLVCPVTKTLQATGGMVFSGQYQKANIQPLQLSSIGEHLGKKGDGPDKCYASYSHGSSKGNPANGPGFVSDVCNTDRCGKPDCADLSSNGEDQKSYEADSLIFETESLMPPPPYGYHVRRNFSNPNSTTNVVKVMEFDSVGNDLNSTGVLNSNDLFTSREYASACGSENSTSSSSEVWQSLVNSQPPPRAALPHGLEHRVDKRIDTDKKNRPRKLMIIGKVKCSKRKMGKQSGKAQLEMVRRHEYNMFGKRNEGKRERRHDSVKMAHALPVVVKAAKRAPELDGRYTDNISPRATKIVPKTGFFRSLDDGSRQYFKVLEFSEKHNPHLYTKRNTRYRPSMKINGGINLKRSNLNRDSGECRRLGRRFIKTTDSQSGLSVVLENSRSYLDRQQKCGFQKERLELLPSYFMNLNSNAGISDESSERVPGLKVQTEAASADNTYSTDQYFSTHGDTEVHETSSELDSNLSPSFTNDGEDVITVISLGNCDPVVEASTSGDRLKANDHGPQAGAVHKLDTFSDLERGQKRLEEKENCEKCVDFRGDSRFNGSTASLTSRDPPITAAHISRHKKKAKTTETTVIKQENNISRKTPPTAPSKEWKKLVINKTRQEKQKQPVTAGDAHKTIGGALEKCNKNTAEALRVWRTGKGSGTYSETFETKIKTESGYEPYLDYLAYKESTHQGRVFHRTRGQDVRLAESEHHYSPQGTEQNLSSKGEDLNHIKRLVSLPETMPSQGSPKKTAPSVQIKPVVEQRASIDVKYPTVASAGVSSSTPVPLKQEPTSCLSGKQEVVGKRETTKRADSPKKDIINSPKKDISGSPNKELNNLQETIEEIKQTQVEKASAVENEDQTEVSRLLPDCKLVPESPNCTQSIDTHKDNFSRRRDSPSQKSTDAPMKCRKKKIFTENGKGRTSEYAAAKDDNGESSNGRSYAHSTLGLKKKNPSRFKTHSRSPEGKRKRRSLKRISTDPEDLKTEKVKKIKHGDKLTDKKRKKKKTKLKTADDLLEKAQVIGATEHLVYKSRSRSNECNQFTETTLCSIDTENPIDTAISEPSIALSVHSKRKKGGRSASSTGRLISSGHGIHGFTKPRVFKFEDTKLRGLVSSSAESTSSMSGSNIPVMSAESLLPFSATTTKTPSKVVQLLHCPKIKKNEKDLQEAELGWNSTFSSDDKGAAEKVKQNQKRAMVRYYIVKPKPKKTEREVGVSKLKRPAPRANLADGEDVGSGSEIDLNTEVVPPERSKPGQGKSVQFSDNIEDLEASKEEATNERSLRRPETDSILHHPITKAAIECIKAQAKLADPEIATVLKMLPQKKEEPRSPVLAPRKRRPVWLKKSAKDKTVATDVKSNEAVKSVVLGVPVKKLHSSDNILKASSRFGLHFSYYPVKATVGSPKISNTSLTDKRKVTYKAWINSIFMAAPMNKATRKVVAKSGSPVDIKEIIEGSSVDAADHFKISKPLHDGDVRSARSVPSLASTKGVDFIGGKKQKASDDSRLISHKKNKEKQRDWSPRSHSAAESKEHHLTAMKASLGVVDGPASPVASSNVDIVAAFKQKNGLNRAGDQGNLRRKDKKGGKKILGESCAKWQGLASQEGRNVSDLERVHYCGDMMELNVLNMGLSWVVQNFFNRLPFLSQRQHDSTSISTRDLVTDHQQLVE